MNTKLARLGKMSEQTKALQQSDDARRPASVFTQLGNAKVETKATGGITRPDHFNPVEFYD